MLKPNISVTYRIYGTDLATERCTVTVSDGQGQDALTELVNGGVGHTSFREALMGTLLDLATNGVNIPEDLDV